MEFKKRKLKDTITHTIRFSGETYDKIIYQFYNS